MKIALVQMHVVPGDIGKNLGSMLAYIAEAKQKKVDLVVFPELCVSGYVLSDAWVNDSFCRSLMELNLALLEASKDIAIAYGNIFVDDDVAARWNDQAWHPNKDGRARKYNAVYVMQNGRYASRVNDHAILPAGIQPKTLLPTYRIFDDERYFFSLQDVAKDSGTTLHALAQPFLIEVEGKPRKVGFEICEDLWCNDYREAGKPLNVTNLLIGNGAEMVVNISASPWNFGKNAARDNRIRFLKEDAGDKFVPFLYVNNVGAQNNGKNIITFDGGTTVYNREGRPVLMAEQSYREEMILVDESVFDRPARERKEEPRMRRKFEAIAEGIKHMTLFTSSPLRFAIGLSGGIDSAVVAALLAAVCGKENVIAINMPSRYNSEATKKAAQKVAGNLGIEFLSLAVDAFVTPHERLFDSLDEQYAPSDVARNLSDENIQAKIRGTSILSNFASRYNRFFTNNGNKLEIALGYATLYGDVNGALAPIGDLTKTEVYEMAMFLNEEVFRREVIPKNLIPDQLFSFDSSWIVPSAELRSNQIDPMKFGYHDALLEAVTGYLRQSPEDILRRYLAGTLHNDLGIRRELMVRWGMDEPHAFVHDLEWFVSTIQKNVFKRIQSPPIIITSRSSYGYDIRESMLPAYWSEAYHTLKKEVLAMERYP